jgi:hypothetical protein
MACNRESCSSEKEQKESITPASPSADVAAETRHVPVKAIIIGGLALASAATLAFFKLKEHAPEHASTNERTAETGHSFLSRLRFGGSMPA